MSALTRIILCDAQTSGGLLFTLPLRQTEEVLGKLTDAGISLATHIGNCLGTGRGRIFIKG